MKRHVILAGLLLAVLSCTREEVSFQAEGIRFAAVGASTGGATKTAYEGTEDPVEHKERIDWIAGDRVRVWSNRAKAGLPPQDNADYVVQTVTPSGLESIGEVEPLHDPLNWKSSAHIFYALYPSPTTEDMGGLISFTACDYLFEDQFKITCTLPRKEVLTWTDDGDLHRGYPDMRHAYLWATASAAEPTHDVIDLPFQPRFTAFEFVFTSSKIPEIHLKSFTLETTDSTPLFGTFTIHNDGTVSDFTGTSSSVTYELDQVIPKDKFLSITLLALYKDIQNLKITVTGDEILTRSLKLEQVDGTALTFPAGKKYRFVNLDFPAVYAEGEGIQWNERLQVLGVGERLDWRTLQEILAQGANMGMDITDDSSATGEDMTDPAKEDSEADGQNMLPDNSGQSLTVNFTDTPAVDFTWHAADKIAIHYNIPEASCAVYFTSVLTSGAGETTATFQVSKSGVRDGYALYPGTMAIEDAAGTGTNPLRVTLPDSWNVDEMPMPLPMAAVNTEGNPLDFKALSGLLRLSLNGIPGGTKSVTLATDRAVCGEFNVDVSGPTPVLSSAVNTSSGKELRLNFSSVVPAGGMDGVLDIPLPAGIYPSLIVRAFTSKNVLLGVASDYSSPSIERAHITPLTMQMDGEGGLADFIVAQEVSHMAGQAGGSLDYTVKQIAVGGGMEDATGYTLSVESNADPEVVSVTITTDALTGEQTIQLTPLAVGTSLVTICASKGNVTLKASTTVTVTNISGIGFRASYPYVPLRNGHVEEAFPVVGSSEISGSFGYLWTIDSGSSLASIDGPSDQAMVRILAGNSATGDVVLRCNIYTGGRLCATATRKVTVIQVPEGTVNGLFSIGNGTAVLFASGNLTYQKSTGQYTLQEHQWSAYSGITSSNKPTDAVEDYYDVFRYECVGNTVSGSMADPFVDRHASPAVHIGSQDTYGWYLLPRNQFQYIFEGRNGGILPRIGGSTGRYMFVKMDGKEGVFVFPDCFEWPDALPVPTKVNGGNSNMVFDTYSMDDFTTWLEPLGCLFLPGGHAAPGYDELGKENLNTKEKFYGRYLVYYDGSRGYMYSTFYNYTGSPDFNFTTPTSTQNMSFGALAGNMPNRWFHIRTVKRYDETYAR